MIIRTMVGQIGVPSFLLDCKLMVQCQHLVGYTQPNFLAVFHHVH